MKSVGPRPPCARHCNIQKIVTPHEDSTAAVNTTFRFPMSDLRPIKPHMVGCARDRRSEAQVTGTRDRCLQAQVTVLTAECRAHVCWKVKIQKRPRKV